jgi:hypothetical protein
MPSVTIWNRLEPRARTQDLATGLAGRVHDPLWLLARQWQVGEFAGRDAGSPLTAQLQWTTAAFDRYASGTAAPQPYPGAQPIEAVIEREAVRPPSAAADLTQATEAGLHFVRLLDGANLSRLRPLYLRQYPLAVSAAADADAQKLGAIVVGRAIDGVRLRAELAQAGGQLPTAPALNDDDAKAVLPLAQAFVAWFDSLFREPGTDAPTDAWSPQRMEYGFALGAAGDANGLIAREYDGGKVDWYTFDRATAPLAGGSATPVSWTRTVPVAPVTFRGMPARRFWEMEDAAVDIGALTAAAEDLGRLLLREFALIYGNDWFQLPLAVPAGSQITITSLGVADSFGLVTPIPHYAAADGPFAGWRLFALGRSGASLGSSSTAASAANLLVVPPSAVGTLDGAAIEDVLLLRDELAEMVWGVERTAVAASGVPLDRSLAWKTAAPPVAPPSAGGLPHYRLGSTVPDYWIPFLPVDVDDGPAADAPRPPAHGLRWAARSVARLSCADHLPGGAAPGRRPPRAPLPLCPRRRRLGAPVDRPQPLDRPG